MKLKEKNNCPDIWIFGEHHCNAFDETVYSLIYECRQMCDKSGGKLWLIILGFEIESLCESAINLGIDEVLALDRVEFDKPKEDIYVDVLVELVRQYNPEVFLFGSTFLWRVIAPRIASMVDTGLTADCIKLEMQDKSDVVLMSRLAYCSQFLATIICPSHRPQMATVKIYHDDKNQGNNNQCSNGKISIPNYSLENRYRDLKMECILDGCTDTKSSLRRDIIIGVGRGIGAADNLWMIQKLAKILGAGIAVTRPISENGWMSSRYQVGQTGRRIMPKVYIACGISGTSQHMMGVSVTDILIAINNDPEADIFQYADYGVCTDILEFLPKLICEIEERIRGKEIFCSVNG